MRRPAPPLTALLTLALVAATVALPVATPAEAARGPAHALPPSHVATLANYLGTGYVDYDANYFRTLREAGVDTAVAFVPWKKVETAPGRYDFSLLDAFAQGARDAGLDYGWYFLYSPVPGSSPALGPPAHWMGEPEVDAQGNSAGYPSWWNREARTAYIRFMGATVDRYGGDPAFSLYYPAYGWMDCGWGPGGDGAYRGLFGYSESTERTFQNHLFRKYGKSIDRLNAEWGTGYGRFRDVAAPTPGEPGWEDFQRFREWSVFKAQNMILNALKGRSDATPVLPMSMAGYGVYEAHTAQRADKTFMLAARHGAAVSSTSGLGETGPHAGGRAVALARLAEAYGADWIAEPGVLPPTAETVARDLGNAAAGGAAFRGYTWTFEYPPAAPEEDPGSWSAQAYSDAAPLWDRFTREAPKVAAVAGALPEARVAVLFSVAPLRGLHPDDANHRLGAFNYALKVLHRAGVAYDVVTDATLRDGADRLGRYDVVVDPLGARDALDSGHPAKRMLDGYAGGAGRVTTDAQVAVDAAQWSARVTPDDGGVQVVTRVRGDDVWLSVTNTGGAHQDVTVEASLAALGLDGGARDAAQVAGNGRVGAVETRSGVARVAVSLPHNGFSLLRLTPAG